jgi:hypothetical protein
VICEPSPDRLRCPLRNTRSVRERYFFFLNFEFQQGSVGMFARILVCSLFVFSFVSGCGSSETVIPTTELTAEQQAAVKREDAAVAEDESQGKLPKPKAKK